MPFEFSLVIELALLGLVTGFLAGLLGIGGGMIMVPFVTAILTGRGVSTPLAIKMAIATSMATIVFTSISSVRAHHKPGCRALGHRQGLAPGHRAGRGRWPAWGFLLCSKAHHLPCCLPHLLAFQPHRCTWIANRHPARCCLAPPAWSVQAL
jgi:hypothetical protein